MDRLNSKIAQACTDEQAMNALIRENKRQIALMAYRTTGRFITEKDEEWQIGAIAFCEAVRSYDAARGNFRTFAGVVVSRRLQDYLRRERRQAAENVSLTILDEETEDAENTVLAAQIQEKEAALSMESHQAPVPGHTPVRDEIEALQEILQKYGFSFMDLAACSPKADKTKTACAAAIQCMLEEPPLLAVMRRTRQLPAAQIRKRCTVPQKVLERHRRYIIAAAEILSGDFPYIGEYMKEIRERMVK